MSWVQKQMSEGKDPREILMHLLPSYAQIPDGVHDVMLWKIIVSILSEPPRRKKLQSQNTIEDLLALISRCSKILVLTGAGVSNSKVNMIYGDFSCQHSMVYNIITSLLCSSIIGMWFLV